MSKKQQTVMAEKSLLLDSIDILNLDVENIAREAVQEGIISKDVAKSFESLVPTLPRPLKIRYLLLYAYEMLEGNPRLHDLWLELLANHGVPSEVLDRVRQSSYAGDGGARGNHGTEGLESVGKRRGGEQLSSEGAGDESVGLVKPGWLLTQKHISALAEILVECADKWHEIGTFLNLPAHILTDIKAIRGIAACLEQVLSEWIVGGHECAKPPTLENLKEALVCQTVGFSHEASFLKENQLRKRKLAISSFDTEHFVKIEPQSRDTTIVAGKKSSVVVHSEPFTLTRALSGAGNSVVVHSAVTMDFSYAKGSLIIRYSNRPDSWPPTFGNTFINLAFIKQGIEHIGAFARHTIRGDMDDILSDNDSIEYEKAFGEYRSGVLLLVEGRPGSGKTTLVCKVSRDWANGKSILKGARLVFLISLRIFSGKVDVTMLDILKLFHLHEHRIFEGIEASNGEGVCFILDGLDGYTSGGGGKSIIFRLIHKKYLPQSMVIVACRPIAISELRHMAHAHIEVLGFLKEQISEYIDSYPFSSSISVSEELKSYLAEHVTIMRMCYLPVHAAMVCFLYDVMEGSLPQTETGIYQHFIMFTLRHTLYREDRDVQVTSTCISEALDDVNREPFYNLCKLAFTMTTSSKRIFERSEVPFFESMKSNKKLVGFVSVDYIAGLFGFSRLYTFVHLTVQEYLAAFYVSKLADEEQLAVMSKYGKEKHMQVVWKFYCGLVNFQGKESKFESLLSFSHDDHKFRCQCAFESQEPSLCKYVILSGERGLSFKHQFLTHPDFAAISFVMSHAALFLQRLAICGCDIGGGVEDLVHSLYRCTYLENLNLSNNMLSNDYRTETLCHCLSGCKKLQELDLSCNQIGDSGVKALADGLYFSNSMQILNLSSNCISGEGAKSLAFLKRCETLKMVDLSRNNIDKNGVKFLVTLFSLDIVRIENQNTDSERGSYSKEDRTSEEIEDRVDSEEFIQGVQNAISSSGKIDRKLAHSIFVGAPGSGKSSLMDRLLRRPRRAESYMSTGVCNHVVIVDIVDNPSTFHSVTVTGSNTWEEVEYDISLVQQMNVNPSPPRQVQQPKSATEMASVPTSSTTSSVAESIASGHNLTNPETTTSEQLKAKSAKPITTLSYNVSREIVDVTESEFREMQVFDSKIRDMINEVAKKCGGFRKWKKCHSLYLRDAGGQVEFQETIALLIFGPSIFFFVFRIDLDFKSTFSMEYRLSASKSINCYTSSITTEEALLQCLASVYAMDTSSKAGVKTHKPLVFIVGTHKDKLGPSADEKIADLNKQLDSSIQKNGFQSLVRYADKRRCQVMFTVDNTSESDEDFKLIRSEVYNLIDGRNEFTIEYPISYLLFCLELQSLQCTTLSLAECTTMAAKYGIAEGQVSHLLQFLHLRLGVIQYFNVDGLRHIVVKEPQVLYNKVTSLIIGTFYSKTLLPEEEEDLKKGFVTVPALDSVISSKDKINCHDFMKLLKHLRIITPCPSSQEERYFIPCVLNRQQECSKEDLPTDILPLYIQFKCKHCPKGLFGVLVTHLMNPKFEDHTTFVLIEDKIFRDQVYFDVHSKSDHGEVSLKFFPSHLEINFFAYEQDEQNDRHRQSSIREVCSNVCEIIITSILRSIEDLHYSKDNVKPMTCLRCEYCLELHEVKKGKMVCKKTRKTPRIPLKGGYWFNEGQWNEDAVDCSSMQPTPSSVIGTAETPTTATPMRLSAHEIAKITVNLRGCSHKWKEIGQGLGFTADELSNIQADPAHLFSGISGYLSAILSDWGHWAPGDTRGSTGYATLDSLKIALDKAGFGRVAQELRE